MIGRPWQVFGLLCVSCLYTGTGLGQPAPRMEDTLGAPFRIRDHTFPNFLLLGFAPAPAASLGRGVTAIEIHYSVINDFQASPEVEQYLKQTRGDTRRALDAADVAYILGLPQEQAYYIDGEFSLLEFFVHRGLTDRVDLGLGINYIQYGTRILDQTIFSFHDAAGFGQGGRDYVENNRVQAVIGRDHGQDVVLLARPSSGGLSDPNLLLRYALPPIARHWYGNLKLGLKIPLMDEDEFLSTGSWDFGYQMTIERRYPQDAWIVNVGAVFPGKFKQTGFEPPNLPYINLSWLHRLRHWTGTRSFVQTRLAEHPYRASVDSDLSDTAIQITAGLKWDTSIGVVGFGVTENFLNFDNTPDFAVHVTWGQ